MGATLSPEQVIKDPVLGREDSNNMEGSPEGGRESDQLPYTFLTQKEEKEQRKRKRKEDEGKRAEKMSEKESETKESRREEGKKKTKAKERARRGS